MKHLSKLFIVISFSSFNAFAQDNLEKSFLFVKYSETSISDTTNLLKKNFDVLGLEIGKSLSRFYSISFIEYKNAVLEQMKQTNTISTNNLSIPRNKKGKDDIIYKNNATNQISAIRRLGVTQYTYQEPIPKINWHIQTDTLRILNYPCQKAICKFRGRTYEAWFTPEINTSEGPWKFNGLPGLILKVSDSKNHFLFECISVEKINREIPSIDSKIQKISKETYVKLYKQMMEDPLPFMNDGKNSFTLETPPSSIPKRTYNPMELTEK